MQESYFDIHLLNVPAMCRGKVQDGAEGLESGGRHGHLVVVQTILLGLALCNVAHLVPYNFTCVIPFALAYELAF